MGEYAYYCGDRIKIGTCEDLYYLRADQAMQVSGGDVADGDWTPYRFRFPFPDEDNIDPGQFEDYDRGFHVPGFVIPEGNVDHYREHPRAATRLVQQRLWEGLLVPVLDCAECGVRYRLPTLGDAAPLLECLPEELATRVLQGFGPEYVASLGLS